MKSAFPSVLHDALRKVSATCGLSESAVNLIAGTLTNIQQKVKADDQFSDSDFRFFIC